MPIDIRRLAGVVRFLVQPFDRRHPFGFFAGLDAVSGQQQTTVDFRQRTAIQYAMRHQRCKISPSCQDDALKKESMAVYSAGSMPSQRTKELAPQRSMRTINPNITVTNQLKAAVRVKQDLKPAKMRLISPIIAPPLLVGVGFKRKCVRGGSNKGLAGVDLFQDSRDDRIPIELDLVVLFSQLDDVRHMQGMAGAVEYVLNDIDI